MKTKSRLPLSVIIIARNEEALLGDCLASVDWAKEIILVDNGSSDRTAEIARAVGAKIVSVGDPQAGFVVLRNAGAKAAHGKWLFYLDADERVTPLLKEEILAVLHAVPEDSAAFAFPRRNFYFGREMRYGNAWPDYVPRLFLKTSFSGWRGELHEEPVFTGRLSKMSQPLIHLTHRDLSSMLVKTSRWTEIEADLLLASGHPPVVWWRIWRMMATKFWERFVRQGAWRDGTEGWLNGLFEVFNTFLIYARLWEKQQQKK